MKFRYSERSKSRPSRLISNLAEKSKLKLISNPVIHNKSSLRVGSKNKIPIHKTRESNDTIATSEHVTPSQKQLVTRILGK